MRSVPTLAGWQFKSVPNYIASSLPHWSWRDTWCTWFSVCEVCLRSSLAQMWRHESHFVTQSIQTCQWRLR